VATLGCKVNQVDSDALAESLAAAGHVETLSAESADVVVVNTCTVTAEADKKSRKAARHYSRMSSRPDVVVTGCMPAAGTTQDGLESPGIHIVPDRDAVTAHVRGLQPRVDRHQKLEAAEAPAATRRGREQLKVQDGCDNRCGYCIVPIARGASRSLPTGKVLARARQFLDVGTSEIVLTGIDLGDYRDGDRRLGELVEELTGLGIERVRLSSIEPIRVTELLVESLAANPAFCRHLHIPLQSGSDRVLQAMARPYGAAEYLETLRMVRDTMPDVAITTDVMAGYPGEQAEDVALTREVCEEAGFSKMHVFRFSPRPGTAAAQGEPVEPTESARRAAELRALGDELRRAFIDARLGEVAELFVEFVRQEDGSTVASGTTREYIKVRAYADSLVSGDVVPVRLLRRDGASVVAEPLREV
jgi:threonylcarbamoyladenosine tRNA methylthiotransferase MtaB